MFAPSVFPPSVFSPSVFPPALPVEEPEVIEDVGRRDLSQFPTGGAIVPSRWTGVKLPARHDAQDARDLKDIHDIILILSALDPD